MSETNTFTANVIRHMKMPEEHREIWEYFLEKQMRYPNGIYVPPFKRPSKCDKPRKIAVAEFETMDSNVLGFPTPVLLRVVSSEWRCEVPLWGTESDIDTIQRTLFSFRTRGWYIVFRFGDERDLRIFCQRYIAGFVARGFQCQPINAGSELIAIKISKNSHSWNLLDFKRVTGIEVTEVAEIELDGKSARCACIKCLEKALDAIHTIQNLLISNFGVSLKMTIGAAAIRAAAMSLPTELWKWRPHPLLVTMCRIGGGFRGGYITGRGYRGHAWMVDTNRMYTWALTRKLPQTVAISPSVIDGVLRDGIYVCTVSGPGAFSAYLPVWGDRTTGFSLRYWNGENVCTVLPTSEIEGLRNLGFTVTTGIGFQFTKTFNMAKYVEILLGIVGKYGRNHPFSRIAKSMGNSVYGKFGESPERIDCIFSTTRPSPDCFPFIDNNGDEIDNLWERKRVRYNNHQHVDIAATITGYGRSQMYDAIAAIRSSGGIIAATNTDSIITDIDPRTILQMDENRIGKWRTVAYDPDGITVARNTWVVGEQIALSGSPKRSRATIELLARAETVVLDGIRKTPVFLQGPISEAYTFTSCGTPSIDTRDSVRKSSFASLHETEASSAETRARSPDILAKLQETSRPKDHQSRGLPYALAR